MRGGYRVQPPETGPIRVEARAKATPRRRNIYERLLIRGRHISTAASSAGRVTLPKPPIT